MNKSNYVDVIEVTDHSDNEPYDPYDQIDNFDDVLNVFYDLQEIRKVSPFFCSQMTPVVLYEFINNKKIYHCHYHSHYKNKFVNCYKTEIDITYNIINNFIKTPLDYWIYFCYIYTDKYELTIRW
jgi:hypothetical protein